MTSPVEGGRPDFHPSGEDCDAPLFLGADRPCRELVETLNEGVAILSGDGSILYCNETLAHILHIPLKTLAGSNLGEFLVPDDAPLLPGLLEKCLDEQVFRMELSFRSCGTPVPVQMSCRSLAPTGKERFSVVVTDLSWQKRKAELLHSDKLSAMILDQAGEAIIVCDEIGRIIRASRIAHKLSGVDIIMQQFDRVFPLQMADESRCFSVAGVLGGEAVDNAEMIFTSPQGRYHLLVNSRPLKDKRNGIAGCIFTLADITARKEVEERLEQRVRERTAELAEMIGALQKEVAERKKAKLALKNEMVSHVQAVEELRQKERLLIQQSRQAAMGEMIGNIAHQWRQPLNTLGLYIQEMPIMYDYGEFTREYLGSTVSKAMQLVFHMSQTIDDFRNFFKPNRERELFSLRESILKTISLIEKSFVCHGININCVIDEDHYVEGYFNEFSQVMLNILKNAKDVIIDRGIANPLVHVEAYRKGKKAVVKVADNAGGIAENILDNLFDPYFTTKGPVGTGVGLFMSKVIIEKSMNGRLMARNRGEGAEFTIEVPHRPPPLPE